MIEIVKIILMNDSGEFLLQLRDNNPLLVDPNQWSFIGGGCEMEENPLIALKREISEEIPECAVEKIHFIGEGYVEIDSATLGTIGFSINKEYLLKNKNNRFYHIILFKGIINHDINYINERLCEGQRADYFKFSELDKINMNLFSLDFIKQNMHILSSKNFA